MVKMLKPRFPELSGLKLNSKSSDEYSSFGISEENSDESSSHKFWPTRTKINEIILVKKENKLQKKMLE